MKSRRQGAAELSPSEWECPLLVCCQARGQHSEDREALNQSRDVAKSLEAEIAAEQALFRGGCCTPAPLQLAWLACCCCCCCCFERLHVFDRAYDYLNDKYRCQARRKHAETAAEEALVTAQVMTNRIVAPHCQCS